jgi:hypothetical protein
LSGQDLSDSEVALKKGDPKNEGKSNDVYENKGTVFADFKPETMFMKTNDLSFSSNDVSETKRFSPPRHIPSDSLRHPDSPRGQRSG